MTNLDKLRRQLRASAAEAIAQGASRADLAADLLCATRALRDPGSREVMDAHELAQLWSDADTYALDPPF